MSDAVALLNYIWDGGDRRMTCCSFERLTHGISIALARSRRIRVAALS